MRRIAAICLVTVFVIGCASAEDPVHTHEPSDPQDTYEPEEFESETPGD